MIYKKQLGRIIWPLNVINEFQFSNYEFIVALHADGFLASEYESAIQICESNVVCWVIKNLEIYRH